MIRAAFAFLIYSVAVALGVPAVVLPFIPVELSDHVVGELHELAAPVDRLLELPLIR